MADADHNRIIDAHELKQYVPYSASQIRRMERAGAFPARIDLGPHRVGWVLQEVEAWIAARIAERDGGQTSG